MIQPDLVSKFLRSTYDIVTDDETPHSSDANPTLPVPSNTNKSEET